MLSKEMIRKSTPTTWALDTGASSPMTDQLHLFREESLRSTSKVPIQVGGGMLYSHQRGTALVNAVDGILHVAPAFFYCCCAVQLCYYFVRDDGQLRAVDEVG